MLTLTIHRQPSRAIWFGRPCGAASAFPIMSGGTHWICADAVTRVSLGAFCLFHMFPTWASSARISWSTQHTTSPTLMQTIDAIRCTYYIQIMRVLCGCVSGSISLCVLCLDVFVAVVQRSNVGSAHIKATACTFPSVRRKSIPRSDE